jgi:hypothetical protein
MKDAPVAVAVLVLALALAGCYSGQASSEDGLTGAAAPEPSVQQEEAEPRFTGRAAERYRDSYRICEAFGPEEVAAQLGVAERPRPAARAHAETYYPGRFFRPAFRGCLDAFRGRDPAV